MSTKLRFDKVLSKEILIRLKKVSDNNEVCLFQYETKTKTYSLPYCVKLSLSISGKAFKAWGNGDSLDEATLKALAEILERISSSSFPPTEFYQCRRLIKRKHSLEQIEKEYPKSKNWIGHTSSGFAVHSNKKDAINGAISELIERHVILKALAKRIPPKRFSSPKCMNGYKLPNGFVLSFYNWHGPLDHYVTV